MLREEAANEVGISENKSSEKDRINVKYDSVLLTLSDL